MSGVDECRPVVLPSGETVRLRGSEPIGADGIAALATVVAAAQRRFEAEHPANAEAAALYELLDAARLARGMTWRQVAREAGIASSLVTRIAQGLMPDAPVVVALEQWASA